MYIITHLINNQTFDHPWTTIKSTHEHLKHGVVTQLHGSFLVSKID